MGDGQLLLLFVVVGEANCRRIEAVFFGTVRGVVSRGEAVVDLCGDKSPLGVDGMFVE